MPDDGGLPQGDLHPLQCFDDIGFGQPRQRFGEQTLDGGVEGGQVVSHLAEPGVAIVRKHVALLTYVWADYRFGNGGHAPPRVNVAIAINAPGVRNP